MFGNFQITYNYIVLPFVTELIAAWYLPFLLTDRTESLMLQIFYSLNHSIEKSTVS